VSGAGAIGGTPPLRDAALRWRALAAPTELEAPPEGLDSLRRSVAGWFRRRARLRARLLHRGERVRELADSLRGLREEELSERLEAAREQARLGRSAHADEDMIWALLVETADRTLGERPYPVQIAAALALDRGCAVEMATGEGKTLVSGLASVLGGWRGRGCHVITVNDYLAGRDRDWMHPLLERAGVSSAALSQESTPVERRAAYSADVTYLTSKEAAADMLRDRLALDGRRSLAGVLLRTCEERARGRAAPPLVMRGLAQAIVDEADSVLLDEASTPLIISAPTAVGAPETAVRAAAALAASMADGDDFSVGERDRLVHLTRSGRERVEREREETFCLSSRRWEECVTDALNARMFFHLDAQYVIADGRAVIVDESTGRLTPDRSWRHGFHQVVEAKEGLELTPAKETLARISFQRFFRLYSRLSGLSGTLREAAPELWSVYGLTTVSLPTHRPCRRRECPDRLFTNAGARDQDAVRLILEAHATARPVLTGVRRVADAERISAMLAREGVPHEVLSATRHAEEAEIIARAGRGGAVTIATNIAGRGTDIRLDPDAREAGGLFVIALERQGSRRLDRQLFGRSGRQGDPGEAVALGSLEDELIVRFAGGWARALGAAGRSDHPLGGLSGVIWRLAQRRAKRTSKHERASVLRHDRWLDDALAFGALIE